MNHHVALQAKGLNTLPKQMCRYTVADVTDVLQEKHLGYWKSVWLSEPTEVFFFFGDFVFIETCNPHKDRMLIMIVPLSPRVQDNARSGIRALLSCWRRSLRWVESRYSMSDVATRRFHPWTLLVIVLLLAPIFCWNHPSLGEVWLLCSPSDGLWRFDRPSPGSVSHSVRICWPFVNCSNTESAGERYQVVKCRLMCVVRCEIFKGVFVCKGLKREHGFENRVTNLAHHGYLALPGFCPNTACFTAAPH